MHSQTLAQALTEMSRLILLQSAKFDLTECASNPLKYLLYLSEEVGVYKLSIFGGELEIVLALANTKVLSAVLPTFDDDLEELIKQVNLYISSLPTEVIMGSFGEDWAIFHATYYATSKGQLFYKPIEIGMIRETFQVARQQKSWPAFFPPINDQLLPYAFHCAITRGYIRTIDQRRIVVYNG